VTERTGARRESMLRGLLSKDLLPETNHKDPKSQTFAFFGVLGVLVVNFCLALVGDQVAACGVTDRTVARRESMLKGLLSNSTAPACTTLWRISSVASAEIKMTGIVNPASRSRRCNSAPLIPGKFISKIRQETRFSRPELKKSSAELKDSTSSPAAVITRHNIRVMDASSSTTEIKSLRFTLVFLSHSLPPATN
jgi:hypothetical protein